MTMIRSLLAVALVVLATRAVQSQDDIREEQVRFPAGATETVIRGDVTGRESVSYVIGAEAGQTLEAKLIAPSTAAYFNIYEPGRGPGDEALASSDRTPQINEFKGDLTISGNYIVSVYLFRNAARAGESAEYILELSLYPEIDLLMPVEGDFADGLQGGPDCWRIATQSSALNMRARPSSSGNVLATAASGSSVRNKGCRMNEGQRWCLIELLSRPPASGWSAGSYLRETSCPEGVATQLPDMIPVGEAEDLDYEQVDIEANADACLKAVATETGGNVVVLSSEFSEAATLLMIGAGPDQVPWRCLVSDGIVDEIMFTGDEGAL